MSTLTLEQEMEMILNGVSVPDAIKSIPTNIDATCANLSRVFQGTANLCEQRADMMQKIVDDLRSRAVWLRERAASLPNDLREAVEFEQESANRQAFYRPLAE